MSGKITKRNLFASVFAVLVVGFMALFFNSYDPWQPIGPELFPDGSFSTPAAAGIWSGWNDYTRLVPDGGFKNSPGAVLTCSSNQNGILRFTVYNLTNIPAFRVSLRAAAQGVMQGQEKYHVPRAIFFYHDANAKSLFNLHHGIVDLSKDTGWKRYTDVFPVPEGAVNARLHFQNLGVSGTLRIDDVSLIPVRERPSAPWWKLFFGTLWMTTFGYGLFTLRPWTRRLGLPIILTLAVIMTGIVLPGEFLDNSIKKTIYAIKHLVPKPSAPVVRIARPAPEKTAVPAPVKPKAEPIIPLSGTGVDSAHVIGHFALFSLLAFLCALSWIPAPPVWRRTVAVLTGLTFFAAATEVLQFIPAGRSAGLSDLFTDTAGMTGAVALVCLLRLINRD